MKAFKMQQNQEKGIPEQVEESSSMDESAYQYEIQRIVSKESGPSILPAQKKNIKSDWIIGYYSQRRLLFEFITCVMVMFDVITIPFYLAFDKKQIFLPEIEITLDIIGNLITLVFSLDVLLGFRKAYLNEQTGSEVRDPKLIAIKYLKSHFFVDLISAIPFEMFTQNTFLRLLPLLKLVRLKQLKRIVTYLQMDNKSRTRIRILYLALRLIIINHCVACGLYKLTHSNWLFLEEAD